MLSLFFGLLCASFILLYSVFNRPSTAPYDPREPFTVTSKIPFLGHLVGLIRYGGAYYSKLSTKYPLPIYSIHVLKSKIYVVNSTSLISAIVRNSKTVSYLPYVKMAVDRLSGLEPAMLECFDGDEKRPGLSVDTIGDVEHALLSTSEAAELSSQMLIHLNQLLDEPSSEHGRPRKFMAWIQHVVSRASSRAVYGPLNPLGADDIEEAFWTFEHNLGIFLLNLAPEFVKKKAINARDKVTQSILSYYQQRGHETGSPLARARYNAPARYAFSDTQIARLEVPFIIAILNNTVSSAFWILYHIFSKPELLADLREELLHTIEVGKSQGVDTYLIKIARLKLDCPLLLSVYHETLRTHTLRPNTRKVLENTIINDQYFLEKGATVQMSTKFVHSDPKNWSPDAGKTDFRRFVRDQHPKPQANAFGSFGAAPHLRPGRHFATTQILAMAALLVMRYDIAPVSGKWESLKQNQKGFAAVPPPLGDIDILVQERHGWQGQWQFEMGQSNLKFSLVSG